MRTVPDRCPGTLRVHEAADGLLARVRVPGGFLSASQVQALALLSLTHGDGALDLTSRGNLQLRGLRSAEGLAETLTDAGLLPSLAHDTARNIVASPLADNRALVRALDDGLCGSPALAALPGRFLLAIDDGSGDVLSLRPDIALQDGQLVLDGRLAGPGTVDDVLMAAHAFLELRTTEWRLRELSSAHLAARLGRELGAAATTGAPVRPGVHGRTTVALAPLGRLTAEVLAELSEVRLTPWRSLVLREPVAGLIIDPGSPWAGVTACAGLACPKTHADVRTTATAHLVPGPRAVHWSGCERRCGLPAGDVVDLVAHATGWELDGARVADLSAALVGSRW